MNPWQFAEEFTFGWPESLVYLPVLALLGLAAWSIIGAARGIAQAHRTRKRNGRIAPGPPPGTVPGLPVDGEPLKPAEKQVLAVIERHLLAEAKARMVAAEHDGKRATARRRRSARKGRANVRTGRR